MSPSRFTNRCSLKLCDGQEWLFLAGEDLAGITQMAAWLMGLPSQQDCHGSQIVYVSGDLESEQLPKTEPDGHPELRNLPSTGWAMLKFEDLNIWSHPDVQDAICVVEEGRNDAFDVIRLYMSLYPIYKQSIALGGLPFHAALLEYRGKGVLLTAASGGGKSTCSRRVTGQWRALCDDETLILTTKTGYRVHPFPTWSEHRYRTSDKTWHVESHLPVSAICFLEQSPIDQIRPIASGRAAVSIFESAKTMLNRYLQWLPHDEIVSLNKCLFSNACEISKRIPSYKLSASLDGQFWEELEKVLP